MSAPAGSGASPARDDDTRLAEIRAHLAEYERCEVLRQRGEAGLPYWQMVPLVGDVPWLLGEVERLRAENRDLRVEVGDLSDFLAVFLAAADVPEAPQ